MKRKLGIMAHCLQDIDVIDALEKIKNAGFETFFTSSFGSVSKTAAIKKRADELGLTYEFIHAPFHGINEMWMPGLGYLTMFNAMKQSIDEAAENGIPYVITHVSSGWNPPQVNDLGLSRYDDIVLYAQKRGVIIAFENLRLLGNLACLIQRYEHMDNVKFCFDNGHEHCYTKTINWLDIFTTKTCCTHIHDNMGRPFDDKANDFDQHLLPFDGTYNYEKMMRKLDEYGYAGSLMLEVWQNTPEYQAMSHEEFLATCYERIKKISMM